MSTASAEAHPARRIGTATLAALVVLADLAAAGKALGTAMPSELVRVEAVEGKAYFRARFSTTPANPPWLAVNLRFLLSYGELRTKAKGRLSLRMAEGSALTVSPDTEIVLDSLRDETHGGSTRILLRHGELRAEVQERTALERAFAVHAAIAVVVAQGKAFSVKHDLAKAVTTVAVQEGAVQLSREASKLEPIVLRSGQQLSLSRSAIGPVVSAGDPPALE